MLNENYKILIIEDNWVNASFTAEILVSLGHTIVDVKKSAKEALLVINKESKIDLIFMDINIEGPSDGIMLANKIADIQEIPIIYISAFNDSNTVKEAGQTNIYGFITKPYTKIDIEINLEIFAQRLQKEQKIFVKEDINNIKLGQGYSYDIEAKLLFHNKNVLQFSKNESKLLYLFCSHYNKVVSLEEIHFFIWKDKEIAESTIRDTISRLRKKVPILRIMNIVGHGYILERCLKFRV